MSVGLSIEKSGQSAEWYITRDVGALLREARGFFCSHSIQDSATTERSPPGLVSRTIVTIR